jgi:hypothetical protein
MMLIKHHAKTHICCRPRSWGGAMTTSIDLWGLRRIWQLTGKLAGRLASWFSCWLANPFSPVTTKHNLGGFLMDFYVSLSLSLSPYIYIYVSAAIRIKMQMHTRSEEEHIRRSHWATHRHQMDRGRQVREYG